MKIVILTLTEVFNDALVGVLNKNAEHEIFCTVNQNEAVSLIVEHKPECLITGYRIKQNALRSETHGDGFSPRMVRFLRDEMGSECPKIILISSYPFIEQSHEGLFDFCIDKILPDSGKKLCQAIAEISKATI